MRLARIRIALPALPAITVLPLHARDRVKSVPGHDESLVLGKGPAGPLQ